MMFSVKLHGRTDRERPEFYSNDDTIVGSYRSRGLWHQFGEAAKAASCARLQDPLNRRVTVEEEE